MAQTFTLSSFNVSPARIVEPSNQTLTYSVSVTPTPINQSLHVGIGDQLSICGYELVIPQGQSSASGTNTCAGAVSQDTPDTLTATLTGQNSTLTQTITLLANTPTISFDNTSLVSGSSTNVHGTVLAPDNGPQGIVLSSSVGIISGGSIYIPANNTSGDATTTAYPVTAPSQTTVTGIYYLNGSPLVYGNSVVVTVFPTPEPYLPCPQCEATTGSPINLTNGNVWIERQDYSIPGLGGGLSLSRTWNSLWRTNDTTLPPTGMFGDSWRSTYEERLFVIDSNNTKYVRSNGDLWYFVWNNAANAYLVAQPVNQHATLTFNVSTGLYTLTFADGSKENFNNTGYLTALVDRNGNQTSVTYDGSHRITRVTDAASRSLNFGYTDANNPNQTTSVTDAVGTVATYIYGTSSQLTKATYADGSFNTFNYDAGGQLLITSVTDSQAKVLEAHTYDLNHRGLTSSRANGVDSVTVNYISSSQVQLTDSSSNTTTYGIGNGGPLKFITSVAGPACHSCGAQTGLSENFDSSGNMLAKTDALGNVTNYTYDANGNVFTKATPLGDGTIPTWTYTYNSFGEVLTATDPLNHTTTNVYDPKGNLLTTTTPSPDGVLAGSITTFTYNTNGTLATIKDPLNNLTTITYYATGLINTIKDANNKITTYNYDARGSRTSIQDPVNGSNKLTTFGYDLMNRMTSMKYPGATASVTFHYDWRGRRDYVIDQNSKRTTYGYDDADRLISVTDPQSPTAGLTQYGYDTENNLTSITDALNHQTIFTYDPQRRLTQTQFPSTLVETYGYDAANNLTSKTDRNSQAITYGYDALGRLTSKSYPDGSSVSYTYDLAGRLTQTQDPTGTYTFTYDNMNRLTQTTSDYVFDTPGAYSVQYSYDKASNRKTMTDPQNLPTTYGYDVLNRLSSLAFNGQSPAFGFVYDALSRRTSLTRPNNVNTTYTYDPASSLLSAVHKKNNQTLDGATYTYDNVENRKTRQDNRTNTTLTYTFDNIYQLTLAKQGNTTNESYSYDLVGNRLSSLGVSPYQYNSSNQLTSIPNVSYTYDNNGNTKTKADATGVTTYNWDFENRLTSVVLPGAGGTVSFKYDPFGRRVQKSSTTGTTDYVYDGANILEEVNTSGTVLARYTQSSGVDEPLAELRSGTTSYYQADGLGSVTSLSNAAAALGGPHLGGSITPLVGLLAEKTTRVPHFSRFSRSGEWGRWQLRGLTDELLRYWWE
jgi:YD repeat-containing protein